MADLNQCTSRTLASKAGISSKLAGEIVYFRKQKGSVRSFSELWYVDGMTRPIMKNLTSKFIIRDVPFSVPVNINNNSNRKSDKNKKQKRKCNAKRNPVINKEKIAKMNSRFLESLPLLSDVNTSATTKEESLLTIYTPLAVQATPSRDKIVTVYQTAPPDTMRSPAVATGILPQRNRKSTLRNESNNNAEISTQTKGQIFRPSRQSHKYENDKLSPTKQKSIRNWLQNTNSERSRDMLTPSRRRRHSRSHRRKRNDSSNRYQKRAESSSQSRSCSRSPLLRRTPGYKEDNTIPASQSDIKHKSEIAESSEDLDRRSVTRRSLWKETDRELHSRSSYRHHRHNRHHHHHHHRHSKSQDRHRSRDKKHRHADSNNRNGNCIIL